MNNEKYQKITQIFNEAVELGSDERPVFLEEACGGDSSLRREVEDMLAADDKDLPFPGESAITVVAALFGGRLEPGQIIGVRYKILEEIGQGGMGEVFAAEDLRTKRKYALKVLSAKFNEDKELLRRFKQEGDAVSKLDHPNIVSVHDLDTIDGISFLVTEFIKGKTLRERLKDGPLSLSETLEIVRQIAEALKFAHAKKIVHRDIKPENIMLTNNGHDDRLIVKVLDFGLAKFTERNLEPVDSEGITRPQVSLVTGIIMGTPEYMSPEQAKGKETDERTDIWSLGVVLYEMLSGKSPFRADDRTGTLAAILERTPPVLDNLSKESNLIISKALGKNPEARYQTIIDFQSQLTNIKNNDGADTFMEWLPGPGRSFGTNLLIGIGLTVICSAIFLYLKDDKAVGVVSLMQVVILVFALWYFYKCKPKGLRLVETKVRSAKLNEDDRKATGYKTFKEWKEAGDKAKIVLERYMRDWKGILIAWLALYAIFVFKGFVRGLDWEKLSGSPDNFHQDLLIILVSVLITFLNNVSAWKIFLCYNLLNKPTEIRQEEQTIDDPVYSKSFGLLLAFSFAEVLFLLIFGTFATFNGSSFDFLRYTLQVFSGASGIAGGIAMALYVGRLQNKFIGTDTWIGVALYSYTAIQPLFLFLEGAPHYTEGKTPEWAAKLAVAIAVSLIDIALILKCLLFLYMAWLFQSGRLLYYLVRVRKIYQKIPEDWQNFRKVLKEN